MLYLLSKSRMNVLGVGNMKKEYKASAKLYKAGKFMMTGVVAVALMGGVTQSVVQPTVSAATKVSKSQRVKLVNSAKSAAVVATAQAKVASSADRVATADSTAASKAQSMAKSAVAIGSTAAKSASSVAVATKAVQNAKTTAQVNSANANIGVLTKYVTKAGSAVHTASTASSAATSASKQASTAARNASVAAKAVSSAAKRASSASKVASSTAANTAKSTADKANNQAKSYATVAATKYKNVGASSVAVNTSLATTKKNVGLAQSAAVVTTKAANNAMSNFYDYVASAGNSHSAVQSSDAASASLSVSVATSKSAASVATSKAASASSSASVAASKSAASAATSKAASASSSASVAASKSAASVAASKAASTSSSANADQLHMTDAEKLAAITSAAYAELNAYRAHFGIGAVVANADLEKFAQKNVADAHTGVTTSANGHKNFLAQSDPLWTKTEQTGETEFDVTTTMLNLNAENGQLEGQFYIDSYVAGSKTSPDTVNGDGDGDMMMEGHGDRGMVSLASIKTKSDIRDAAHAIIYSWGIDMGHKKNNLFVAQDGDTYAGIAVGLTPNGEGIVAYVDFGSIMSY